MDNEIAKWSGVTDTHGFYVAVFKSAMQDAFTAKLYAYTPVTSKSNCLDTTTKFYGPAEITAVVLEDLERLVRERIAAQFGAIEQFDN